jgi:hypothetical protein
VRRSLRRRDVGDRDPDLNSTQLNAIAGTSQLQNVVFHEIGHTLGFGIMWYSDKFNYVAETACFVDNAGNLQAVNPEFLGPLAVKAWQDGGKTGNPTIEDTGGPGTMCAHWRKSVFRTELMTGTIEPPGVTQPISSVTIASMADLGFKVDMTKADPFVPPGAPMALHGPSPWGSEIRWPGAWEIVQNEPIRRLGGPGHAIAGERPAVRGRLRAGARSGRLRLRRVEPGERRRRLLPVRAERGRPSARAPVGIRARGRAARSRLAGARAASGRAEGAHRDVVDRARGSSLRLLGAGRADSIEIGHPGGGGVALTLAPAGRDLSGLGVAVGDAVPLGGAMGPRPPYPVIARRVTCGAS